MLEIAGFFAAALIGISLGLLGGGGSILTVPVLVYLLGVNPVLATAYSLFVVGASALLGAVTYMRKGLVHYKTAFIFALPSFISVFLTRKYLIPALPDTLHLAGFSLGKDQAIMVFFSLIMLVAAFSMISSKRKAEGGEAVPRYNYPLIALEGGVVGLLTGIVGAGGGFLIIPALVLLARLPMKMAVGTSLLIIAAKSLLGFLGDLGHQPIEWPFMLLFTTLALGGILIGSWLSGSVANRHLKQGFGWLVLLMGLYILLTELLRV